MTADRNDVDPEQLVLRRKQHVQRARDRIWADGVAGGISVEAKRLLATATMSFWDVLQDYRDAPAIDDDDWPDMQPIHSRMGETTEIVTDAPGFRDRGTTTTTVPAVAELDADRLIAISEQLDEVAEELGFGVEIDADQGLIR